MILLTGFQDFAYAQQAIQYNVFSLLTKPLDLNQLRGCLLKIRSKIEENLTMEEAQRDRNNHHSVTGNIAAGALLRRYLLGLSVSEEEKSAFVREAGIGGKKSYIRCAVCMAEKEERLTTGRMDGEDDRLVVYRLALGDNVSYVLFDFDESLAEGDKFLQKYCANSRQVGNVVSSLEDLNCLYILAI